MNILLLTSRNIDKHGGEKALIAGRHSAIYSQFGVGTDVIFYHKDTYSNTEIGPGLKTIDCKLEDLYTNIETVIASGRYSSIILSGKYDSQMIRFLYHLKRQYNIVLVVDIHGTIREVYENTSSDLYHFLGTRYLYIKKRNALKKLLSFCDYVFVVSNESIEEMKKISHRNNIKYMKVHCGTNESIVNSNYFEYRKYYREKFQLENDELAFVYLGSSDPWQKYDETIKLFKRIQQTGFKSKFFFYRKFTSSELETLKRNIGENNIVVRWVDSNQMAQELSAFDVGILLRDNLYTNKVAFPNKYSDYIHGALDIVLSPVLQEPYSIAQENNLNIYTEKEIVDEKVLKTILNNRTTNIENYVKQCNKVIKKELLYSMQVKEQCKDWILEINK